MPVYIEQRLDMFWTNLKELEKDVAELKKFKERFHDVDWSEFEKYSTEHLMDIRETMLRLTDGSYSGSVLEAHGHEALGTIAIIMNKRLGNDSKDKHEPESPGTP